MSFDQKQHNTSFEKLNSKKHFPNFKKPNICGYFSIDEDRQLVPNCCNLKYLNVPLQSKKNLHYNLDHGYSIAIKKPELLQETEKINHLLKYLSDNIHKHLDKNPETEKLFSFDILCFRGLLTKIMGTPYERNDSWSICASVLHGNIYLCDFMTDYKKESELNQSEKQKRCSTWGYKFEQYMLTDDPKERPDTSVPVNQSEEFCCMLETKLNDIKLMYGAEMDGLIHNEKISSQDDLNKFKFVELKTNRHVANRYQLNNLIKFKYRKWWCQCFMAGIQDVLVGFRNDNGIVSELQHLRVSELSSAAQGIWSAHICIYFLIEFFELVKKTILEDQDLCKADAKTVWKFDWDPPGLNIRYQKFVNQQEYVFIPEWYSTLLKTQKVKSI